MTLTQASPSGRSDLVMALVQTSVSAQSGEGEAKFSSQPY